MDLLGMEIYASRMVRPSRIGLPSDLMDMKSFKNVPQGHTLWRLHDTRKVSCIMWKDKKLVLLISTHDLPIQAPCKFLMIIAPRRQVTLQEGIPMSYFYWCIPQICREWM